MSKKTSIPKRTPGSLHPAGSTAPASAYRDAEGWVLFDGNQNVIEDWPASWPKTVDSDFLKTKGVRPVRQNEKLTQDARP